MYRIEEREPEYFEFEYKGETLKVPIPASMPTGLMLEYAEAASGGAQVVMQWIFGYFMEQTEGAIGDLPFGALVDLVKEWQASSPGADLGK